MKLTYILAASHSGSTLLAMLLNAHPEVCTAGELKLTNLGDVTRYRCSCGERIRQCRFWAEVAEGMARRGMPFDVASAGTHFGGADSAYCRRLLRPLHRGQAAEMARDAALALSPTWRAALPQMQRRNALLMETIAELSGARVVVDSSKSALRLKYLLRNPDLDVRVIRLVRDGRAVALTYMDPARFADASDPALRGGGMGGDRQAERLSLVQAAREWRRSNEEAEALLGCLDRSRWIHLRYEDYCADPAGQLRRLFEFLSVDPSVDIAGFRSREHHVLGNGMRLDGSSRIRLDERWRTQLEASQLAILDDVAGRMLRRLGYV